MPNTRNIRHRIQSVRNTSQITRAMQTVAASKMRRAQDAAVQGRPFAQLAMQFLAQAAKAAEDYTHPLLEAREVRRRAVILVSTDKGLCGALNANLFRQAAELDAATTMFIAAGRKGAQFLARAGRNLVAEFPYHETPLFSDAQAIAQMARQIFSKKEADEVAVLYPRFVNTLVQKPETVSLLPMNRLWEKENLSNEPGREYLFEPTVPGVMDYLLRYYLDFQILQILQETRASEHSARMVSMKNATENAEQLLKDLTLAYNKIRQAAITTELLDNATAQMAIS